MTNKKFTPKSTWSKTYAAIKASKRPARPVVNDVEISILEAGTSLSADSNMLFSATTCGLMIADYLKVNGNFWVGNSLLSNDDTPSNWKSQSQFISLALSLAIVDKRGANFRCNFSDFERVWNVPNAILKRWQGKNEFGPDYVVWNLDGHNEYPDEFIILECKGLKEEPNPAKFAKYKTQTLNHTSSFPVARSILCNVHFEATKPVKVDWFNATAETTQNLGSEPIKCMIAFTQLATQLRYIGQEELASDFIAFARRDVPSAQFTTKMPQRLLNIFSAEPDFSLPATSPTDKSVKYLYDYRAFQKFIRAAYDFSYKNYDSSLKHIGEAVINSKQLEDSLRGTYNTDTDIKVYPTGVGFVQYRERASEIYDRSSRD